MEAGRLWGDIQKRIGNSVGRKRLSFRDGKIATSGLSGKSRYWFGTVSCKTNSERESGGEKSSWTGEDEEGRGGIGLLLPRVSSFKTPTAASKGQHKQGRTFLLKKDGTSHNPLMPAAISTTG